MLVGPEALLEVFDGAAVPDGVTEGEADIPGGGAPGAERIAVGAADVGWVGIVEGVALEDRLAETVPAEKELKAQA